MPLDYPPRLNGVLPKIETAPFIRNALGTGIVQREAVVRMIHAAATPSVSALPHGSCAPLRLPLRLRKCRPRQLRVSSPVEAQGTVDPLPAVDSRFPRIGTSHESSPAQQKVAKRCTRTAWVEQRLRRGGKLENWRCCSGVHLP